MKSNRKNKLCAILLLVCLFTGIFSLSVFAENDPSLIVDETEDADPSELHFPDEAEYLFVGNSLTHFNNIPYMFQEMVRVGQGYTPSTILCSYSGRALELHAKAIEAAVESRGHESYILDEHPELQQYFLKIRGENYDPDVFHGYCKRLLKPDGTPKHFDNIVLQLCYGTGDSDTQTVYKAVCRIMQAMGSPSTKYTIVATMPFWPHTIKQFIQDQNVIDTIAEKAAEEINMDEEVADFHNGDVEISYYGRGLCNYLLMCGSSYAQNLEPEAYEVYHKRKRPDKLANDVMIGDSKHPTQLGSYIGTATLYTLMYGSRPQDTIAEFRATSEYAIRVDSKRLTGKCSRATESNEGMGFFHDQILLAAAEAAYRTQADHEKMYPTNTPTPGLTYIGLMYEQPTLISAECQAKGNKIKWSTNEQKNLVGSTKLACAVMRKEGAHGKWKTIAHTSGTSYLDTTAKPGTTYYYTARFCNLDHTYPVSKYDTTGLKCVFLKGPKLKSVIQTSSGVKVSWKKANAAKKYLIFRRRPGARNWVKLGTTSGLSYTDKTAVKGKTYYYTVRIADAAGNGIGSYNKNGKKITVQGSQTYHKR